MQLSSAINGSAGSMEGECLALSVAVEGILKILFPDIASVPEDFASLVTKLYSHIDAWVKENKAATESGLARRMNDFKGMLLGIRANDRLEELRKQGVIEQKHIKAWKDLRHPAAHGAQPGTIEWQVFCDLRDVVTALLYRIIFHAIGYKGYWIDYGTRGYPPGFFPPVQTREERDGDKVTYRTTAFGRELVWIGEGGKWRWETWLPGTDKPDSKGPAMNSHQALQIAFDSAASALMGYRIVAELPAEAK